jgi:hypothetical protein
MNKLLVMLPLAALLSAAAPLALAQYQWIDENGRRVISDRPPPNHVPERNILRRPSGPVGGAAPAPAAAPSNTATRPVPGAQAPESELDQKKKAAEAAEAAKKKQEEQQAAKVRADNCERATQAKRDLDSGVRLARTNAQGEREVLNEAQRAQEAQRLTGLVAENCRR